MLLVSAHSLKILRYVSMRIVRKNQYRESMYASQLQETHADIQMGQS